MNQEANLHVGETGARTDSSVALQLIIMQL